MIRWEEIANFTSFPFFSFDKKKIIIFANEAAKKIFPDLVGMTLSEALQSFSNDNFSIFGKELYYFGKTVFYIDTQVDIENETFVFLKSVDDLIESFAKDAFSSDIISFVAFIDGPTLFISNALSDLLELNCVPYQNIWGTMSKYLSPLRGDFLSVFSKEQELIELRVLKGPNKGQKINFKVRLPQKGLVIAIGKTDIASTENRDALINNELLAVCDEISPYGTVIFDSEYIVYSNFHAKEILSLTTYKGEKIPIKSIKFVNDDERRHLFEEICVAIADTQKVSSFQIRVLDNSNHQKTIRFITKHIIYLRSKPGMLAVVTDATRQFELQKKVIEMDSVRHLQNKLMALMSKKPSLELLLSESLEIACKTLGFVCGFLVENIDGNNTIVAHFKNGSNVISEVLDYSIINANETSKSQYLLETIEGQTRITYVNPLTFIENKKMITVFYSDNISSNMSSFLDNFVYTLGLCIEFTKLQNKYKENQDGIQKLIKFRNNFLETINHELKTPLTSVLGYAEFISSGMFKELPQITDAANSIRVAGKQIENLINELSSLSKDTFCLPEYNIINLPTRELLISLTNLMMPIFDSAMVNFTSIIPNELPEVLADETKFKEIIINLLSNAAKYTEPGDEISLTAEKLSKGFVKIIVKDTGIGIPNDKKKYIFQKYAKLSNKTDGKGLGLYLSKMYAEAMGSRLYFESEGKGKGSVFYFVLPVKL